MRLLWRQDRSDFDGRFFQLSNAVGNPKPIQQPHPPIWIGAAGAKMLRVVAEHADVWNSAVGGLEAAATTGERLMAACQAIGRDAGDIRWSGQVDCDGTDPEATIAELGRWWEAGFSELIIYCQGADPVRSANVAAEKILPQIRKGAR